MSQIAAPISANDQAFLRRCVVLAEQALEAGDEPFGSILVDGEGQSVAERRNSVGSGDATRHPEFALARWAAEHMTPAQRARSTVYTSGEHCPMCAAAHAWVGLGPIVYASSMRQLLSWFADWGVAGPPVAGLSIEQVAPNVPVSGPDEALSLEIEALQRRYHL